MAEIDGLSFRISLDSRSAERNLASFTQRIRTLNNVMKANFTDINNGSGAMAAYTTRIHDANQSIKAYDERIGELKHSQEQWLQQIKEMEQGAKGNGESQAQLQKKYLNAENTIVRYTTAIRKLQIQQEKDREAVERLKTGVDAYRKVVQATGTATQTSVKYLADAGSHYAANRAQVKGLKTQVSALKLEYESEKQVLTRLSDSYAGQLSNYKTATKLLVDLRDKQKSGIKLTEEEANKANDLALQLSGMRESLGKTSVSLNNQAEKVRSVSKEYQNAVKSIKGFSTTKLSSAIKTVNFHLKENSSEFSKWKGKTVAAFSATAAAAAKLKDGIVFATQKAAEVQAKYIETNNLLQTSYKNEIGNAKATARAQKEVNQMRKEGQKLSNRYGVAQKDIADYYEELVKKGYSGKAAIGSMNSMLKASLASGDEASDVVKTVSAAIDSFGLRVNNTSKMMQNSNRVANTIASAADRTSSGFKDMGIAMSYAGATAHSAGVSLEQTAAALGVLSNNGIEGSMAGTSLRKVLNSLISPTDAADKALKKIGLSTNDFVDKSGKLKDLDQIFALLGQHTTKLTSTEKGALMKTLFGATGMQAGIVLEKAASESKKLDTNLTSLVNNIKKDSQDDYVGRLAKKNMNSVQSQMAILKQEATNIGIDIGYQVLPNTIKVSKELGKWAVSKDGKQTISETSATITNLMKFIAHNAGHAIKFATGFAKGLSDSYQFAKLLLTPVTKFMSFLGGSEYESLGKLGGWLTASYVGFKLLQGPVGFLATGFKTTNAIIGDIRSKGKATATETAEQIELVNKELAETVSLLQQANGLQAGVNPELPTSTLNTPGVASSGVSKEKLPTREEYRTTHSRKAYREAGEKIGQEVAGGAEEKIAQSNAVQNGVSASAEAAASSGVVKGEATLFAEKFNTWMGVGIAGLDIANNVSSALTASSKSEKLRSTTKSVFGTIGGIAGLALGGQVAAMVLEQVGSALGEANWAQYLVKESTKAGKKQAQRGGRMGWVAGKSKLASGTESDKNIDYLKSLGPYSKLSTKQLQQSEKLGKALQKNDVNELKVKFVTDTKSMNKVKKDLNGFYSDMFKKTQSYYSKRKKEDKDTAKEMLKNGQITKKQYQKIIDSLDGKGKKKSALSKQIDSNKKAYKQLTKDTNKYLKDRRDAYEMYGNNQELLQRKLNGIDKKYNKSRKANVKKLTSDLEKAYSKGNNKSLAQMKKYVKQNKKLSDQDAKTLINNSAKATLKTISNAQKQKDKVAKAAEEEYQKTKKHLKHLRDDTGALSKKQYNDAVEAARNQRDDTIDAAEAARAKITTKAKKQHDSVVKYAKKQNKSVSSALVEQKDTGIKTYNKLDATANKTWKSIQKSADSFGKGFSKWVTDTQTNTAKIVNTGIGAINGVISAFGGSKNAIPKIKLATGTGAFSGYRRAITKPTLALLNDGLDSPETGNKEMIWRPSTGQAGIVQGRNTTAMLMPGDEVFNASETKAIMAANGITRFAKGTGAFSTLAEWVSDVGSWAGKKASLLITWFKKATAIIANPTKALNGIFKIDTTGLKGAMKELNGGMMKSAKKSATTWWNTLWNMASDKLGGGSASGLLGAVEKYGSGKPYVWGAEGPNSFDCSGLVKYALEKAFGIDYPHFSGSQYARSKKISRSEAKAGDLVFWGSGGSEHVGVYAGGNNYYSAQSPSQGIGMNTLSSVVGKGSPLFARVVGLKDTSKKSKSTDSGFEKKIRSQVGSGFWKFLEKLGDLFGGAGGTLKNIGGSDVTRWKPYVVKALKANGLSASQAMIAKVLRQINTESSGNPYAKQAGADPDGDGSGPAMGLMQTKRGTFNRYAFKGHKNIYNGYDSLLAGLAYAKARYGSSLYYLGNGHGYANGGLVAKHGLYEVAEGNKPEMIIPMDMAKRSRAYELMSETLATFKGEDQKTRSTAEQGNGPLTDQLNQMLGYLQSMIQGMQEIISNQNNPVPAVVSASDTSFALNKLKKAQELKNKMLY